MWSAAVNLFEVVTLIAVALFLLVGVVVAALRPAPLLGLFLGRLRPPARLSALAARVALWAEVCATWGHITAATPPALGLGLGLGLLRRSGFDCSVTHDQRRGVWCAMCHLVEPCTLLFDVALVTVALQHCLANRTTPRPTTPRGVLEACLQTVPALDRCRGRGQVVVGLIVYVANSAETQLLWRPKELAARSFTRAGQRGLPG